MRLRFISLLALLSCLIVPACGVVENRPPLRIATIPWPGYEYLFLAREKRFFEGEGGRVQLIEFTTVTDARRAYERGQVDGLSCTLVEMLHAMENSRRTPQIVTVLDYSDGADVLLARRSIRDTASLAGRRVGLELGSVNTVLLHRALQATGLSLNDVSMVPHGLEAVVTAIKNGEIDAAVTFPPFSTEILSDDSFHVLFSSHEIPGEIVDVIMMEKEIVASRPADVSVLVRGHFLARDFAETHPDIAYPILASRLKITPEEFRERVTNGIRLLGRDDQAAYFGPGGILEKTVKLNDQALRESGQLSGADRTNDFIATAPPVEYARR